MTEFVYVRPNSSGLLPWSEVARIADSLRQGSLAVLPTETGYMLAALATDAEAVKRAFAVKERPGAAVMHIACASVQMAGTVGILTERALRLLELFTPGPVSVIVNQTDLLAATDGLVTLNGTVGLRIPDHPGTLQIINAVGMPVTATSLNSSGATQLAAVDEETLRTMNWPDHAVIYVVVDDDAIVYSSASTLVRLTNGPIEILRVGPVSESDIRKVADRTAARSRE
jgi:L-threonylcarbamoyladenylate synthase